MTDNFYNLSAEEVERRFATDAGRGLKESEAQERLRKNGYNEFAKKKRRSLAAKFFDQFKSFMIIALLVAAIISGTVGILNGEGFTDAIIILIVVIMNAIIGVMQEAKAEKSLEALERMSSPHCKVVRDGQTKVIESRELVVGDVVLLETGDSVPADLRLVEAVNLKVQEAALTGESLPGEKTDRAMEGELPLGDRDNMVFSSSSVVYGRGKGIVTAVGMQSEVGKIASMIQSVQETKTPMQDRLDKLGRALAIIALVICGLIFAIGLLYGRNLLDMFMTAVSLAVAAIPEGLPAVSTIVLAIGVQRLAKRNAIVRKLPSVETLGSTNVICSDKTGTLTQNRMTVVKYHVDGVLHDTADVKPGEDGAVGRLMQCLVLANDAKLSREADGWKSIGDPTETALLDWGVKSGRVKTDLENRLPRVAEIPFDSERKLMTTVHQDGERLLVAVKGGLDELLACCDRLYVQGGVRSITPADKDKIMEANLSMAQDALRVLAVAYKELDMLPREVAPSTLENGLVFVGMVGMIDPPREEVKAAVERCRAAGIKPVMITGDHKMTAVAIARALGIMDEGEQALTGLDVENMSDEELRAGAPHIAVYARVSPEHKVRIVKAFQSNGNIVAMTGDGVNDAPALKLADIGVAMGITGTDVSKEAADVVLADDNFATIVSAVEEGRRIYDNILKAIQSMLSANIGGVLVLFVSVVGNWVAPLLPIHILWINLVTDSLPALALSVDSAEEDIMKRKPVDSRKGIMTKSYVTRVLLQGGLIALLSLIAYHIGLQSSVEAAQTMTFGTLVFAQMMLVFTIRSGYHTAFKGMFQNKYLLGAVAAVVLLMLLILLVPAVGSVFHTIPLTSTQWWWVAGLALSPLPITEIAKLIRKAFIAFRSRRSTGGGR